MAKSSLNLAALEAIDTAAPAAIVTPQAVTVAPKLTITALRANFPEYFARPTISQLLAKGATDALVMATLTGYAMHKAHSGMGVNEPGMADVASLIIYTKDKKSVTAATQKWANAYAVLSAIENKSIGAGATLEAYTELAAQCEVTFGACFIKPVKAAKPAAPAAPAAPATDDSAADDSAADDSTPTARIASAIELACELIATMDAAQLDTIQASLDARRATL